MINSNKTIYIHMGLAKTGTSSIQSFLYHNREELSASGLLYPIIEENNNEKNISCANLRQILYKDMQAQKGIDKVFTNKSNMSIDLYKERFDTYFLPQIEKHDKILFSEEILSTIPSSHYFVTMLKDYGFNVKIICYVRPAAEWVAARWSEDVRNSIPYPLAHYIETLPCLEDVRRMIFYTSFIGKENMIVRPYESCQWKNSSLLSDFLDIFSIDISNKHKIVEPLHKTAGRNTTELMRLMGHLGGLDISKQGKLYELMKNQKAEDTKIIDTFSDEQILEITNKVHVYYDKLAELNDINSFFVNMYPACYEKERMGFEMIHFNQEQADIFTLAIDETREEKIQLIEKLLLQNQQLSKEVENLRSVSQIG